MSTQTAIVVVPCHFKSRDELCATTIKRLDRALLNWGITSRTFGEMPLILTGPVPYERGNKTLGDLMEEYLLEKGVPQSSIIVPEEGVGIFSEAQTVVADIQKRLPRCRIFSIISSDWYFIPGWKIWSHFASQSGLGIRTIEVLDTGGAKTRLTYLVYGIFVWLSFALHLNKQMGRFMTWRCSGRKNGFKFNGCA